MTETWSQARSIFQGWLKTWLFSKASGIQAVPDVQKMMHYSLLGKGKHFRPVLYLVTLKSLGLPLVLGRPTALALECLHTYSLVHDDLPCMDDDDRRRGQPSAHIQFGEAGATLSGDGLLTLAFELVAQEPGELAGNMVQELAQAAGAAGMVGGQALDLNASHVEGTLEQLEDIHKRKTGALIGACLALAGWRAHRSLDEIKALRSLGVELGLIFQVQDDILDVVARPSSFGKTVGKDASQGKLTYAGLLGCDGAREHLIELVDQARGLLNGLEIQKQELENVIDYLIKRES